MRFIYLNILLSLLLLASGCASSGKRPNGQLFSKVLDAPRQLVNKVGQLGERCRLGRKTQPLVQSRALGCHSCGSMNCAGSHGSPCDQTEFIQIEPTPAEPKLCDCVRCRQKREQQLSDPQPIYGYDENVPPVAVPQLEYDSIETPVESLAPPVAELESPSVNVEEGSFDSTPTLLTEPPPEAEPAPYVEPGLDLAPPQLEGVAVPELEPETGFLSPQRLSDSPEQLADKTLEIEPAEPEPVEPEPVELEFAEPELATPEVAKKQPDAPELASVLGPTEAEQPGQKILQSKQEDRVVVLKARPVLRHKVNNQRVLRGKEMIPANRTDSYGLPMDSPVYFAELPRMDSGTRPRPVNFQRNVKPMPPVKHIETEKPQEQEAPQDKTTMLEQSNIHVVESTTNQPVEGEPMLRMTAVPYAGKSSLGAAIARIKVGKTPLIVRGAYPRDLEHERLARERNEQATRSVIIPNASLKTIDR